MRESTQLRVISENWKNIASVNCRAQRLSQNFIISQSLSVRVSLRERWHRFAPHGLSTFRRWTAEFFSAEHRGPPELAEPWWPVSHYCVRVRLSALCHSRAGASLMIPVKSDRFLVVFFSNFIYLCKIFLF